MVAETVFSQVALDASWRHVKASFTGEVEDPRGIPWPPAELKREAERLEGEFGPGVFAANIREHLTWQVRGLDRFKLMDRRLDAVADAVKVSREGGVDVVLFIPPLTEYYLEILRQSGQWEGFLDWKRRLAHIAPLWDFTGYHDLARTSHLFVDTHHLQLALGWALFRRITGRSLDGARGEDDLDTARPPAQNLDHVTQSGSRRRGDQADRARQARQRLFALGLK